MPVLSTTKQEIFAQRVAAGCSHAKAAREAGYASPISQGYQLSKIPTVVERIRELQNFGQSPQAMTVFDTVGRPLFHITVASGSAAIGFTSPNQIEFLKK